MSIVTGKLLLVSLVPVVSAGVAYPLVTKFGGGETQINYFETNCWVSIQGNGDDDSERKLLVCPVSGNNKLSFYFYKEAEGTNVTLPQAVVAVSKDKEKFKITFERGGEEAITVSGTKWDGVFKEGIKNNCQIEETSTTGGGSKKLKCGDHPSQRLETFKVIKK